MAAHYRQLGWLLWLVALTCSAENQYGPSFDCKQAKLEIETLAGDIEREYGVDFMAIWHEELTLGELFAKLQQH